MINNDVNNSFDKLQYKGMVKVSVIRGNKTLRKKVFTNKGRWPLFRHMVEALRGNYSEAENFRPMVVGLYSIPYNKTSDGKMPIIVDTSIGDIQDDKKKISTYANYDYLASGSPGMFMTEPKIDIDETQNIGNGAITYTFLIPFSNLNIDATSQGDGWYEKGFQLDPINLVCLYGRNNCWTSTKDKASCGNPSAYFFVTDETADKNLESLIPKDINALSDEYSLKIEWILTLSNK